MMLVFPYISILFWCLILGGVMVVFTSMMLVFPYILALFQCPILGGVTVVFISTVSSFQSMLVFIYLHCDGISEIPKLKLDNIPIYTPYLTANQTMRTPGAQSAMESASNQYQDFFIDF